MMRFYNLIKFVVAGYKILTNYLSGDTAGGAERNTSGELSAALDYFSTFILLLKGFPSQRLLVCTRSDIAKDEGHIFSRAARPGRKRRYVLTFQGSLVEKKSSLK